jgi:hypothetical protein
MSAAAPIATASVEIDAPIAQVWSVMLDAARYAEWNPFVVELRPVDDALVVGGAIHLHVKWSGGGGARTVEVVSRLDAPAAAAGSDTSRATMEYRFVGWLPRLALVRGSRVQSLEQRDGGPTIYRTEERFTGLLARRVPLRRVQDGFERHAHALKQRAEALHATARTA